jgi:hypothetical protein
MDDEPTFETEAERRAYERGRADERKSLLGVPTMPVYGGGILMGYDFWPDHLRAVADLRVEGHEWEKRA